MQRKQFDWRDTPGFQWNGRLSNETEIVFEVKSSTYIIKQELLITTYSYEVQIWVAQRYYKKHTHVQKKTKLSLKFVTSNSGSNKLKKIVIRNYQFIIEHERKDIGFRDYYWYASQDMRGAISKLVCFALLWAQTESAQKTQWSTVAIHWYTRYE